MEARMRTKQDYCKRGLKINMCNNFNSEFNLSSRANFQFWEACIGTIRRITNNSVIGHPKCRTMVGDLGGVSGLMGGEVCPGLDDGRVCRTAWPVEIVQSTSLA